MAKSKAITWWEPYGTYWPRARNELRPALNPLMWLRVTLLAALLVLGYLLCLQRAYPGVPSPIPLWRLLLAVVALPLMVLFAMVIQFVFPPYVGIRERAIVVSHGQSGFRVSCERLVEARVVRAGDGATVHFSWHGRRGKVISRRYGVAPKVNLAALEARLAALVPSAEPRTDDSSVPRGLTSSSSSV